MVDDDRHLLNQAAIKLSCDPTIYLDTLHLICNEKDSVVGSAAPIIAEFWQLEHGIKYRCEQLSESGGFYHVVPDEKTNSVIAKVVPI